MNKQIQIFQGKNGEIEFKWDMKNETIWGSLNQIVNLFWKDKSTISRHIKNIFESQELEEKEVVAFFATPYKHWSTKGNTQIHNVKYYNLDMIISVWYRVNSKQATEFRKWATSILKNYLVNGYTLNKKRLQEKWYNELEKTLQIFKKTLRSQNLTWDEAFWLLDIITKYTNSWLLLQKYDEDNLKENWKTKTINYKLEAKEAYESLSELKQNLIFRKEATELFANPREKKVLEGIFWNIYQTFGWDELYPSLEEKASNLLYFIIKNHPFFDGNKRSWAFLFILFLARNKLLFDEFWERKINDRALVAITLLIAESNPKDKEIMVKLVLNLIN